MSTHDAAGGVRRAIAIDRDDVAVEQEVLGPFGILVEAGLGRPDALAGRLEKADALLVIDTPVDASLLAMAPRCRIVVTYGVGYDNIDLAAAAARGVAVANVPGYCTEEVADHTLALILAAERGVVAGDALVRDGGWQLRGTHPLRRLRGRTLGLVGLGRIGRAVAERATGFGLLNVAFDPYLTQVPPAVTLVSRLEDLLPVSDILSLHVPLTPKTHHLVDGAAIDRLPVGATIVNASRGALLDLDAALAALDSGHLRGLGLDAFEQEPPDVTRLASRRDVVLSPHIGYYSEESMLEVRTRAAQAVAAALTDAPVPDRVI